MKKITLLALFSCILIIPSFAQEESPAKETYDKNVNFQW